MARKWLNLPLSAALLMAWLLVNSSMSAGQLVLGGILALLLPVCLGRFRQAGTIRLRKPLLAIRLWLVFMWDIGVANLQVARQVLFESRRLKSELIHVPLDTNEPLVAVMLGAMVTLTPGTVTIEADAEARRLIVHVLHTTDSLAVIQGIKQRYEQPLKEIFGC
ncbi:Na+/H+ antiporter subunit E [Chitinivorax sp. B]|uniref:Na+/H+ antiporter subunit E n=1 Tax=Chitinivorax sp. B TaxID=2502235 RepID=UPI0010F81FB6|nr:Na+/H+ antiporter subunit E [Chitinivorax sp. B]